MGALLGLCAMKSLRQIGRASHSPGQLDITMYVNDQSRKLADDVQLPIGRNDRDGCYFECDIYRTSSSSVSVAYHLAGYREQRWNW